MWKILTWNIAGLPYWFNIYGNPELRISNIIKKLLNKIVTLYYCKKYLHHL